MQPSQRCDLEGGPSIHILGAENDNAHPRPQQTSKQTSSRSRTPSSSDSRGLRCLSSATRRRSFLWHGAAPADPFLRGHGSTAPVGGTQCPRVAQCIQNDLPRKPAIDTGVWRPGVWCASPKTTAQETPAATVDLLPDSFVLLLVGIFLGGSRRDQILSGKSGITFPTHEKRRDPSPVPPPSCLPCPLGLIRSEEAARLLSEARPQAKTWA